MFNNRCKFRVITWKRRTFCNIHRNHFCFERNFQYTYVFFRTAVILRPCGFIKLCTHKYAQYKKPKPNQERKTLYSVDEFSQRRPSLNTDILYFCKPESLAVHILCHIHCWSATLSIYPHPSQALPWCECWRPISIPEWPTRISILTAVPHRSSPAGTMPCSVTVFSKCGNRILAKLIIPLNLFFYIERQVSHRSR